MRTSTLRLGSVTAVASLALLGLPAMASATDVEAPAPTPSAPAATTPAPTTAPANNDDDNGKGGDDSANVVELDLYNLTDVHGHIEKYVKKGKVREAGLAAVACYLDSARSSNPNSAFTLLGDNIGASPFTSGVLYDNPTIKSLNELKPVASTIGNHELDLGQDVFRARLEGTSAEVNGTKVDFEKVAFPYMAANIDGLGDFKDGSGPYLKPYTIWTSPSGVRVAYIAGIAEDVPYKLSPGTTKGLTFSDPIEKINSIAKELKTDGKADVAIAMLDDDVKNNIGKMDSAFVDGLMGGDTHVVYQFNQGVDGAKISATASGSYTDNLAAIKVFYDTKAKKVVKTSAEIIPASKVVECSTDSPAATKVSEIVDTAAKDAKVAGEQVISSDFKYSYRRAVHQNFDGSAPEPGSNRGAESTLGDLIADSFRSEIHTLQGKPVDIGVINAGGIREDLLPTDNKITYADTYAVMPFSNEVGYVTLTGAQFVKLLNEQWKGDLNTQNSRPMLKLGVSSNVHYVYDATKPAGERIVNVTVNGAPIDPNASYTVGSVSFLLQGGDSFETMKEGNFVNLGDLDRDLFNKYLREQGGKLMPEVNKRSIGLSLISAEDGAQTVELRGLSFTEGEGVTKQVELVAGDLAPIKLEVNNEFTKDTIERDRTDGHGIATVPLSTIADQVCSADGTKSLPIKVISENGTELVSANEQVTLELTHVKPCGVEITPAPTEPGHTAEPGHTVMPGDPTTPAKPGLPNTGAADPGYLGALALMMLAAGGVVVARKRNAARQ